ncbi:MAG TPA: SRPBCC family protein [Candidatus Acidoferrales bacterium]|nr:SRPBCC family protein [Candidatus Acidoferrales bacterium]
MDKDTAYELIAPFTIAPDRLFKAFLDETVLKKLWGVSEISIDARAGGTARAKMTIANENWNFTLTYDEISPNEKLRWSVHFDRFPQKETRVTLLFKRIPAGTELTVRQENFDDARERDANREAWRGALNILGGLLA